MHPWPSNPSSASRVADPGGDRDLQRDHLRPRTRPLPGRQVARPAHRPLPDLVRQADVEDARSTACSTGSAGSPPAVSSRCRRWRRWRRSRATTAREPRCRRSRRSTRSSSPSPARCSRCCWRWSARWSSGGSASRPTSSPRPKSASSKRAARPSAPACSVGDTIVAINGEPVNGFLGSLDSVARADHPQRGQATSSSPSAPGRRRHRSNSHSGWTTDDTQWYQRSGLREVGIEPSGDAWSARSSPTARRPGPASRSTTGSPRSTAASSTRPSSSPNTSRQRQWPEVRLTVARGGETLDGGDHAGASRAKPAGPRPDARDPVGPRRRGRHHDHPPGPAASRSATACA